MTKAYSGLVQEATSLIRNIVLLFIKTPSKAVKLIISLIIVAIAVTVGVLINIFVSNNVWYGYLPVSGTLVYSTEVILAFMINMSEIKAEIVLKVGLLLNSIIWSLYGYFVMLYTIMIFNIITIVLCIISFIRIAIIVKNATKVPQNDEIESQ